MQQEKQERDNSQAYDDLKKKKMRNTFSQDFVALTAKPKYMYSLFNLFELQVNRFANLQEFKTLANQIIQFNQQIDDWKKKNKEIKNILLTYHLYQNLFSRMKFVSNLVIDRGQGKKAYEDIAHWYFEQKPKIRNQVPDKLKGQMKQVVIQKETEDQINTLIVSNSTKRELKAYQSMARTAHTDFYPPKQRLLEYKRKDLLQGFNHETQRRASSVSNLTNMHSKYRGSLATTRTSFKKTSLTELKKEDSKIEPVIVPFELTEERGNQKKENDDIQENQLNSKDLQDLQKQKKVQQDEILQQNIVQVINQEDQQDGQQEIFSNQQKNVDKAYKKYKQQRNADDQMIAQEDIKDVKQSTLRRILKQKQEAIRTKMEQLNVAKQMGNWAAVKSRQMTDEHRKMERTDLANKYTQLKYIPKTFEERQSARKRDIPQYPVLYRSKSSHPGSIQNQIQKIKLNNALKTYGRYIQHIEIKPIIPETQQQKEEMRVMRSTSLTSFCRQGKKTPFSKLIQNNGTDRYNDDAEDQVSHLKQKLAKKLVTVQKLQILNGLGVVNIANMQLPSDNTIYAPKKTLFSNPFFPKHLYETKKKKKK